MESVLFLVEPKQQRKETCNTCDYRQRWSFNGKIFQYCSIRKSGRTSNGLLKIKCKSTACDSYRNNDLR